MIDDIRDDIREETDDTSDTEDVVNETEEFISLEVDETDELPELETETDEYIALSTEETGDIPDDRAGELERILANRREATDEEKAAIAIPLEKRTWRQFEEANAGRLAILGYDSQRSFLQNPEGELEECPYGRRGSQRPDHYLSSENDIHEAKVYGNTSSLLENMERQTEARKAMFGDDVNITFDISSAPLTVGDAERIQQRAHELGVHAEFILK